MQITVNIPDSLAEQAKLRGIAIEVYVEQLLAERMPGGDSGTTALRSKSDVDRWLKSLSAFSDRIPALPDVISREWLYQDHD